MATQQMDEMEQHIANLGQPPCEPPSEDLCPLSANSQMPGDAQVQVEQKETDVLLPNSGAIVKYVPPSSTLALAKSAWDDLKGLGDQAGYCVKCNRTVNLKAEKVVRKKGHSGLTCSACNSVTTSLYRHYNVPNTGFSALSAQEQQAFYAKACELRAQDPDGKLRFSKLQGLLQESLVKREVFLTEKKDTGKFLPLSVYEKKGYDLQPIRERAEQRQDPLFGTVYRVGVLEVNHSHLMEQVRERLQTATRKVRRAAKDQDDDKDSEDDLKSMDSESEDSKHGQKRKLEEPKNDKETKSLIKKHNSAQKKLADKVIKQLQTPLTAASKLEKKSSTCTPELMGLIATGKAYIDLAKKMRKKVSQAISKEKKVEDFELTDEVFSKFLGELKQAMKDQVKVDQLMETLGESGLASLAAAARRQ
ncbi:Uncharacterized protein SCF082_LOCUS509, partial [Durusdinium trenchii]